VIFALLVGFEIYGIIGALLALPLTAIARETVEYLRRHLVLEPWGTPSAPALAGAVPAPAAACPECARAAAPGDDFCRVCGAELGPGVVARRR